MANLVKAYLTRKGIPKNKEFIPGDIIVFEKTNSNLFFGDKITEELYILDLKRKIRYLTKKDIEERNFAIDDNMLKKHLGKHWEKYKLSYYYNLKIPFNY